MFVLHMLLEINCIFIFNFYFSFQSPLLISTVNLLFPVFKRMLAFLYCYFSCFLSFFLLHFAYLFLFFPRFVFPSVFPFLFSLISLLVSIFISYLSLFPFPLFHLSPPFFPSFLFLFSHHCGFWKWCTVFGQMETRYSAVETLEGFSASWYECGSRAAG